jgi:glycosyltransferase involved in cell wall biosynthesis
MKLDITLIIPYYNECKTILKTLNLISNLSVKPNEVILVNSSSTDNTSNLINEWIECNNINTFKNIFMDTNLPSTSKNIGVHLSSSKYIAFMDCDLNFEKEWLLDQYRTLTEKNLDVVFGKVMLSGNSLFDICCTAHTYGFEKVNECVPGTVLKKSSFKVTGDFLNLRAGYDPHWRKEVKKKLKYGFSNMHPLTYMNINYAKNLYGLIKKTIIYTFNSSNINISKNNIYLLILYITILVLIFFNHVIATSIFIIYFTFRSFLLPLIKSKSIFRLYYDPRLLFWLPVTALVIDFSKIFGALKSLVVKKKP